MIEPTETEAKETLDAFAEAPPAPADSPTLTTTEDHDDRPHHD